MSTDPTTALATSPQDVADIVFGPTCPPCSTEVPCNCGDADCICECGRCSWPYPLPDDGPLHD